MCWFYQPCLCSLWDKWFFVLSAKLCPLIDTVEAGEYHGLCYFKWLTKVARQELVILTFEAFVFSYGILFTLCDGIKRMGITKLFGDITLFNMARRLANQVSVGYQLYNDLDFFINQRESLTGWMVNYFFSSALLYLSTKENYLVWISVYYSLISWWWFCECSVNVLSVTEWDEQYNKWSG